MHQKHPIQLPSQPCQLSTIEGMTPPVCDITFVALVKNSTIGSAADPEAAHSFASTTVHHFTVLVSTVRQLRCTVNADNALSRLWAKTGAAAGVGEALLRQTGNGR